MSGTLYVVSTPIGNLGDITLRALEVLRDVDLVACEDTRTTVKLLTRYSVKKPLQSYHEHNEKDKAVELLALLEQGKNIALVTDAGTPGISDPGYRLVSLAAAHGIRVIPVPGPSAAISALSVSGLPTSGFVFFGFLPRTKKALSDFFHRIKDYPETLIFYESPRRVVKTLGVMLGALGDRDISFSREMTKLYEETIGGKVSEVLESLGKRPEIKGEVTLVVGGAVSKKEGIDEDSLDDKLEALRKKGFSLKESVLLVSGETGLSKSRTYKRALSVWGKE